MEEQDKKDFNKPKVNNEIKGIQSIKDIALFLSEEFNKINK